MLEQKFQKKIINYLEKELNCYVVKVISSNKNGTPDIIACYKGKFLAIEVKTDSKVSALQEYQIRKIKEAQGIAFVLKYTDDWKSVIKERIEE